METISIVGEVHCVNCGTDLGWWVEQSKRNKVYIDEAEDFYCSKRCFCEYYRQTLKTLKQIKLIKE